MICVIEFNHNAVVSEEIKGRLYSTIGGHVKTLGFWKGAQNPRYNMRLATAAFVICVLGLTVLGAGSLTPHVVPWNITHYGPDGPWQAVTVNVGGSQVDLLPGGIWETVVISKDTCDVKNQACSSTYAAGLYDEPNSRSVISNFTTTTEALGRWGSGAAMNVRGSGNNLFDTLTLETSLQGYTNITNCTIFATSNYSFSLPNGASYPMTVGSLSLGAWGAQQDWDQWTYYGWTIPGYLQNIKAIPSNSFGMHIGSVLLGIEGSLMFGGYDQGRVLGDVGSYDLGINGSMATELVDIGLGVAAGVSPFAVDAPSGLLKLNSSEGSVKIDTIINPLVPYLFLPVETCTAITQHLPVTLASDIGLYIWNTEDPAYQDILVSPTYLSFMFQSAGSNNTLLTIKVPLALLNLTLDAPIVPTPIPYFPCRPYDPADPVQDPYLLGRAFLQAAFIGANWDLHKFFLAQAPGPGVGSSQTQQISPDAITINSNPIGDFDSTWARSWTPKFAANTSHIDESGKSGLSAGGKAGIAVGVIAGAAIIAVLLFIGIRWRRRNTGRAEMGKQVTQPMEGQAAIDEKEPSLRHELDEQGHQELGEGGPHEINGEQ